MYEALLYFSKTFCFNSVNYKNKKTLISEIPPTAYMNGLSQVCGEKASAKVIRMGIVSSATIN